MIFIKTLLNLFKVSISSPRYLFLISAISLFTAYIKANFWDAVLRKYLVARFSSASTISYFRVFLQILSYFIYYLQILIYFLNIYSSIFLYSIRIVLITVLSAGIYLFYRILIIFYNNQYFLAVINYIDKYIIYCFICAVLSFSISLNIIRGGRIS